MSKKLPAIILSSILALFFVALGVQVYIQNIYEYPKAVDAYQYIDASVGAHTFMLAVADTNPKRIQGLSGVRTLGDSSGMLFIFEGEGVRSIWMKDMYIDLDILWLDTEGRVIHIEEHVAKETYPEVFAPEVAAKYVIELASGATTKHKIKVGNEFIFSNLR